MSSPSSIGDLLCIKRFPVEQGMTENINGVIANTDQYSKNILVINKYRT